MKIVIGLLIVVALVVGVILALPFLIDLNKYQNQFKPLIEDALNRKVQLQDIRLTPRSITQGLDILRDMKTLTTIGISFETENAWPAAEFWGRYNQGEFTK